MIHQAQITLKIDSVLKEKTISKVKKDGITLKALIIMAMKGCVQGDLSFGLYSKEKPSQLLLDTVKKSEEELKKGQVHSFENADDMIQHLQHI